MADVIRKSTNRFTKGLIMDFSPENTKNEVLTNALNATLLTFNGNELSLQNDMGNARVETAYLPEGYMPVGTCEYGGIIYIVSYNPLEDKSLIGCFPSPERNISNDELGIPDALISREFFQDYLKDENGNKYLSDSGLIKHNTLYVLLKNDNLNPGDKFIVCANKEIYNEKLADLWVDKDDKYYEGSGVINPFDFEPVKNPIIALNVVSIEDSGKIVYLNSDIRQYEETNSYKLEKTSGGVTQVLDCTDTYKYHILGKMIPEANLLAKEDIDVYRNVLSSGYSVFKSKTSGKLAILAELIMIDSYSVTHSVVPRKNANDNIVEGTFDVIIHTEITPEINEKNYVTVPKLLYYYLQNSQGYLQTSTGDKELFVYDKDTKRYIQNDEFFRTHLSSIYVPTLANSISLNENLYNTGKFNFPKPDTYHGKMVPIEGDLAGSTDISIYTKFTEGKFHRVGKQQIMDCPDYVKYYTEDLLAKFYYYHESSGGYTKVTNQTISSEYIYYVKEEEHTYYDAERDTKYKNSELFELSTSPIEATTTEINDNTIEKFKVQEIITFKEATNEDLTSGQTLYQKEEDNKYVLLVGAPVEGETYYVSVAESTLVSIGTVVDKNTVSGTIYYYPETKDYVPADPKNIEKYWDFTTYPNECPVTLYYRETEETYIEATENQIKNFEELGIELYYNTDYTLISDILKHLENQNIDYQIFIVVPIDTFVPDTKFVPTAENDVNIINGVNEDKATYPKDDPIFLYTVSDFIPEDLPTNTDLIGDKSQYFKYHDVKLANITLPSVVFTNGLDLPFKYDYTIVPCMNYGKLAHLAVSNTVDFNKLHAFNQSDFTTWKYRIEENQLRLTFGAEIYDTYETYKVDALILEFYDCWGFAGSLEIVDKKSYSGIFTKIIPLNSFKALSRKKIYDNTQFENFKRNINIQEYKDDKGNVVKDKYVFEGTELTESEPDPTVGWNSLPDINERTKEEVNDCGTLYSNVLYGVKTYIRRPTKTGVEFIKKKDFFLYTLPIYNDYYYSVQDFSSLTYPELELVLTYKLKDTSTKNAYNEGETIVDGYSKVDKANVDSYLGGFYKGTSLDLVKYYKYTGQTDLYLEIGLKKDYESLNISCDNNINQIYRGKLLVTSGDDKNKTFIINSGVEGLTGDNQILNYKTNIEDTGLNKFGFKDKNGVYSDNQEINNIYDSNFINNVGKTPIKLYYEFVVGYTASIANIRDTQVLATTVCALFHKTPTGEYNYEDFGVYEQQDGVDDEGNPITKLLTSVIFYNEGDHIKEVFGICRQIKTNDVLDQECKVISNVETEARDIKIAGQLNSGEPLQLLVAHIGKLSFCLPHAHGLSTTNGVNIHEGPSNNLYGIPPEEGGWKVDSSGNDEYDNAWGISPSDKMYKSPKYNLVQSTKNMINYYSEFISTLHYETFTGYVRGDNIDGDHELAWIGNITMRRYTGFTGDLIATFNEKMIETMKSVYAYNPDYDSLTVNVGNVSLLDYNPNFSSNLLNTLSSLDFKDSQTLNNYLYLGPINFANYLNYLNKHSKARAEGKGIEVYKEEKPLAQLLFIPNFDYCGTETNNYLISSLTYNTPVPKELEYELEFSASNMTVIKHWDGQNSFLQGTPNKKTLYGFDSKLQKMVLLDVSNYTINENGELTLLSELKETFPNQNIILDKDVNNTIYKGGVYTFDHEIKIDDKVTKLKLGLTLSPSYQDNTFATLASGDEGFFVAALSNYGTNYGTINCDIELIPSLYVISSDNSERKYTVELLSMDINVLSYLLNDKVSLWGYPIPLYNQSYETLSKLIDTFSDQNVDLIDANGTAIVGTLVSEYRACETSNYQSVNLNGITIDRDGGETIVDFTNTNKLHFVFNPIYFSTENYLYLIGLLKLYIENITFTVTQSSKLESTSESFVKTKITTNYYDKLDTYTVKSDYNEARLRGSSITLNDLLYEPSPDGHRLFMKNNLSVYNPRYRGKLYYRYLGDYKTWRYRDDTKYKNSLFIFTGPCYTTDNL